jgi:hypothetical protein
MPFSEILSDWTYSLTSAMDFLPTFKVTSPQQLCDMIDAKQQPADHQGYKEEEALFLFHKRKLCFYSIYPHKIKIPSSNI